ncbi:hypothetical protein B0H13DRAFT_1912433 [Mycena leptocephala]|nr:hypothetical protein B0H13DRAFT_1912433 [Mycena leptocephala]
MLGVVPGQWDMGRGDINPGRPSFPGTQRRRKDLEDATRPDKSTKEDKMEPGKAVDTGRLQNIRVYWLAFLVYWVSFLFFYSMQVGIVLFGYNTCVVAPSLPSLVQLGLMRQKWNRRRCSPATPLPLALWACSTRMTTPSHPRPTPSPPSRRVLSAAPISAIIDHREQTHPGALHAHLPPRCRTHHCGRTASRSSTRATSSTASSAALSAFVSECSPKKAKGCSRLRSLCGDDWLFS